LSGKKFADTMERLDNVMGEIAGILEQVSGSRAAPGQRVVANLGALSGQLRQLMAGLAENAPQLSKDVSKIVSNMSALTTEFSKMAPQLTASAESIPLGTKKMIELMTESVTVVRAMQRSFLLRGSIADIREEDAKRIPASVSPETAPTPAVPPASPIRD
jgi:phospholipid/cholesterol/gamma-HCH transport system substrate-binding protein